MNKWMGIGRATSDADVRYANTANGSMAIARYTLAVDRRSKKEGEPTADFIRCIAFGKAGEFAEKYVKKGTKLAIVGRIQTGSYEKDGQKVYTTDVVVEEQEFAESKKEEQPQPIPSDIGDGFMNIPDGLQEELPFN